MSSLQLRPGISFCLFEDCAIVLDIDADRYWRLDRQAGAALAAVRNGDAGQPEASQLARLIALNFIAPAKACNDAIRSPKLAVPVRSALDAEIDAEHSAGFALSVGWWSLTAHLAVRLRPLANLLAKRIRPDGRAGGCDRDLNTLAVGFRRYRRLMPLPTLCLPDSLALLGCAAQRGHHPHLVFGVTADPFTAHCWVQSADTILNDTLDHISVFTPILVV